MAFNLSIPLLMWVNNVFNKPHIRMTLDYQLLLSKTEQSFLKVNDATSLN